MTNASVKVLRKMFQTIVQKGFQNKSRVSELNEFKVCDLEKMEF